MSRNDEMMISKDEIPPEMTRRRTNHPEIQRCHLESTRSTQDDNTNYMISKDDNTKYMISKDDNTKD